MQAQAYQIEGTKQLRLELCAADVVIPAWQAGDGSYWLDVTGEGDEVLDHWLTGVAVDDIIAKACRESGEMSRVIPIDDAVFFRIAVYDATDNDPVGHLAALCLPRLLVTFHSQPLPALSRLARELASTPLTGPATTSSVVYLLLLQQSESCKQESLKVHGRVNRLAAEMDRNPSAVALDDILNERAIVRGLDTVDEESRHVYAFLQTIARKGLNLAELQSTFQAVIADSDFLARTVDRLENRLAELHQRYVVNVQERTNQRLAYLTALSAIFLPLTLLAGIYGMNFDHMPELRLPYAYPVVLGVMALIAVSMWLYFKTRDWFD